MHFSFRYDYVYFSTFAISVVNALFCFLTMISVLGVSGSFIFIKSHNTESIWCSVLSLEIAIVIGLTQNHDPRFPKGSDNHNVYQMYIISLLGILLTVLIFMIIAIYGLIIAQVAIMTYLLFCLTIWLNLFISFFVLSKENN